MFLKENFLFKNQNLFLQSINLKFNKKDNYNFPIDLTFTNLDPDFIFTIFIILTSDLILKNIFGKKSRYFQLHAFINLIVSYRIYPDILKFIINPSNSYRVLNNNFESYLILNLHVYHFFIVKSINLIEKIHHLLFVVLGVIPVIFYIKTNQIYLGYIACAGLPGVFEYTLLSLLKNEKISNEQQKFYTSYLYNYFRYPLALYGCNLNLISWKQNKILNSENLYLSIYINFLLFLNGSIFNQLTLKSYYLKYFENNFNNKLLLNK